MKGFFDEQIWESSNRRHMSVTTLHLVLYFDVFFDFFYSSFQRFKGLPFFSVSSPSKVTSLKNRRRLFIVHRAAVKEIVFFA